jgi:hypothetical protein
MIACPADPVYSRFKMQRIATLRACVAIWIVSAIGCTTYKAPLSAAGNVPILLFNGSGTSPGDVVAIETLLNGKRLRHSTINSSQLNQMAESDLRRFRLLIVPGGNFIEIENGLTSATTGKVRNAVQDGLNYLGICAGAFFASTFPGYNGLNLTSGTRFGFYSLEDKGIHKAAVAISVAGAPTLDQYWEDGPQLSGWGAAVAKYPDGRPAIVEGAFGSGWVILTGVHPEAPERWRRGMSFTTSVTVDNAFAGKLIEAALNREPLPQF